MWKLKRVSLWQDRDEWVVRLDCGGGTHNIIRFDTETKARDFAAESAKEANLPVVVLEPLA